MLVTRFSVAFVAPIVAVASASASPAFEFPASVPLEKRQRDGPAFECHSDCGNAILKVRAADVCDDKEWQGLLESCLDCALEYDIWRYYGGELEPAAKECGIDATPKPAGGDSDVETESVHQMPSSSAESQEEPQTELSGAATTSSATTIEVVTSAVTTIEVTSPAEAEPTPAGDHDDHHEHDEHEEHTPSDIIPPTPTPSHVEAAAGALEASKLIALVGVAVAVFAGFN